MKSYTITLDRKYQHIQTSVSFEIIYSDRNFVYFKLNKLILILIAKDNEKTIAKKILWRVMRMIDELVMETGDH